MSLKDEVVKTIENVKDAVSEGLHRGAADAEHTKRETAGDAMPLGDQLGSLIEEGKNNVQAEIDKTKRDVRSA